MYTKILEMCNTQISEMRKTHADLSCAVQERELRTQLHILHQGSKMCMQRAQNLFLRTHGRTSTLHKRT